MLSLNCVNSFLLTINRKKIDILYVMLICGTVLFFISDNLLVRVIFVHLEIFGSRKINSIVIMVTYYLGQYLIVLGISYIRYK